jgi:hypothetical protein
MSRASRTKLPSGRSAIDVTTCEIADCLKLIELIEVGLTELGEAADKQPRVWGYAGDAAEVRLKLEEVAIHLVEHRIKPRNTEAECHDSIRRLAGIQVERSWQ